MDPSTGQRRVVILGNPNTGKTTLFNALTGLTQRVANYPGITVEKVAGTLGPGVEVVDLPGTYSLAAYSPEEMVTVRVLLGDLAGEPRPDLAVVVADAGNLPRNLYLATQVMETGIPVIVALNKYDRTERSGLRVDVPGLERSLGVPVVPTVATRRSGIRALREAIEAGLDRGPPSVPWSWPAPVDREVEALRARYEARPFVLRRALVDEGGSFEEALATRLGEAAREDLRAARERIRADTGVSPEALEIRMRYGWIQEAVLPHVQSEPPGTTFSDRVDALLTHRFFGAAVLVIVFTVMFLSIFQWAGPFMDWIDGAFGALGEAITSALAGTALAGGILQSFLVDGLVSGVGSVLVFLPQIVFLFLFISVLEDCGYLARAALLLDRLLRKVGLSGHSFLPLLSSFACSVPGIMATRTIADRRDRLATILVAPLMTCSARLPVYVLLISAFVPPLTLAGFVPLQGVVFTSMYFLGIVIAAIVAMILKRTLLRGQTPLFVIELPSYRWPAPRIVAIRVIDRARDFLVRAGTVIFAMSIIVWALGYFPRSERTRRKYEAERTAARTTLSGAEREARLREIGARESGEYLRGSFLGRMGRAIEPAVRPLGWDWRIGMAVIASFPAREVVISTLGVIYDLGRGAEEEETGLVESLRASRWPDGTKVFDLAVALSLLVFFALCCQCAATIATIRRETHTWRWPLFVFGYMTALAWVMGLVTYQVASALLS